MKIDSMLNHAWTHNFCSENQKSSVFFLYLMCCSSFSLSRFFLSFKLVKRFLSLQSGFFTNQQLTCSLHASMHASSFFLLHEFLRYFDNFIGKNQIHFDNLIGMNQIQEHNGSNYNVDFNDKIRGFLAN